nr:uncharacterized protein LOC126534380 isoform X4 [Dermacentor andersoni]
MTAVASTARWTSRRCFFPGFDNKFCHNTSRWVMSAVRIAVLFYLPLALSGVTLKDLKEALNTREKIWTVYRSYYPSARGHNQTCIYSEMRMTKRGYYIADTHYEVDGVWKSERNYARLISSKREPVMRVSPDLGKVHCEVRTWQDHVRATVPLCRKAYKSRCGKKVYPTYTPQCST